MGVIHTHHVLHKLSIIEVNCFPVRFKLLGFFSNLAANNVSRRLVLQDSQGSALRELLSFEIIKPHKQSIHPQQTDTAKKLPDFEIFLSFILSNLVDCPPKRSV